MSRSFIITSAKRPSQPQGGPVGVNFRLEQANSRYHFLENTFFVYRDCISFENNILQLIPKEENSSDYYIDYTYKVLDSILKFTEDDVFIFHDIDSACYAKSVGIPQNRTLLVYHAQGSLYDEHLFYNPENFEMKAALDKVTECAMEWSKRVGFPSIGGMDALIESEPKIGPILDKKYVDILYNGCDAIYDTSAPSTLTDEAWEYISNYPCDLKFISVANLVDAKGIDTLPAFFAQLKRKKNFLWIIVGNGPQAVLISNLICESGIAENVLWIKDRIPNEDILKLMSKSNFYIMSHRKSIFDFSTIEAMHMGNIPVLSFVGGNKEVIVDNNGFFLTGNAALDAEAFIEYFNKIDLQKAKEKNMDIADKMFSEESFLASYLDVVSCLMDDTQS